MSADTLKFYEVGKELGLTKKEITQIKIFDNSKYPYLWGVLLIIVMFLIISVGYMALRWLFLNLMEHLHSNLF